MVVHLIESNTKSNWNPFKFVIQKSWIEYIDMGILECWTADFGCGPGPDKSLNYST